MNLLHLTANDLQLTVRLRLGHDFRTDYKRLVELRHRFPNLPIMALTATATPRVRLDILNQLRMNKPAWFIQSFNRPNLKFEVKQKNKDSLEEIANIIKTQYRGRAGIIYCLSRWVQEKVISSDFEFYRDRSI